MSSTNETFTQFVTQAPAANTIGAADRFALIQGGVTKKLPPSVLEAFMALYFDPLGAAAAAAAAAQTDYTPTIITVGASYNAVPTDTFIAVSKTSLTTIHLLSGLSVGKRLTIADCGGYAGTYPITVAPGGGDTIDGGATFIMPFNWQSIGLQYVPGLHLWKVT